MLACRRPGRRCWRSRARAMPAVATASAAALRSTRPAPVDRGRRAPRAPPARHQGPSVTRRTPGRVDLRRQTSRTATPRATGSRRRSARGPRTPGRLPTSRIDGAAARVPGSARVKVPARPAATARRTREVWTTYLGLSATDPLGRRLRQTTVQVSPPPISAASRSAGVAGGRRRGRCATWARAWSSYVGRSTWRKIPIGAWWR